MNTTVKFAIYPGWSFCVVNQVYFYFGYGMLKRHFMLPDSKCVNGTTWKDSGKIDINKLEPVFPPVIGVIN